ncbi:hypothetical protein D3I60_14050 [Brevibacterium permense]|uniref:hypothetical protein n=1 Tax=Brevibacterium permense TaxID=234834 RepID=UPI0021D2E443|nr:hypothetical protein [Brevibacterium permense]MCU4298180.1 hypothetical protein [Brevibacterium permense]
MNSEQYMDDPVFDVYAPMIRSWDQRTKIKPDVFPGCQLAKELYAETPILAWTALVASVDNLAALLKLYEHESLEFHDTAFFSIARPPLLAASTAYWLLAPRKYQHRIRRGLSLLEENLVNIDGFQRPLVGDQEQSSLSFADEIEKERSRIANVWQSLGVPPKEKPDDTWIVDYTARTLEKQDRCDHTQVLSYWRLCSGHAHAMRWAMKMPQPENPYTSMNNLMGIGVALTYAAFELWDERTLVQH